MKVSDEEQVFLREIHRDPRFGSLMRKVETHARLPRWHKKSVDFDQKERWIHASGFIDGVEFVLHSLGYSYEQ